MKSFINTTDHPVNIVLSRKDKPMAKKLQQVTVQPGGEISLALWNLVHVIDPEVEA